MRRSLFVLAGAAVLVLRLAVTAFAEGPADDSTTLHYRGTLEMDGRAANTPHDFVVTLENSAGTAVWTDTFEDVPVNGGAFSLTLGSGAALPDAALATYPLFARLAVRPSGATSAHVALAGTQKIHPGTVAVRAEVTSTAVAPRYAALATTPTGAGGAVIVNDNTTANALVLAGNTNGGGNRRRLLLVDDVTVGSALQVGSTLNTTSHATLQGARVGDLGFPGYAGIAHMDAPALGFGLLQAANGLDTVLNTGPLGSTRLTVNNVTRVALVGTANGGTLTVDGGGSDSLRIFNNTQSPWAVRIVNRAINTHEVGLYLGNDGFFYATNRVNGGTPARLDSGGNWSSSSDRRLKRDLEPMHDTLPAVMALRPVSYFYKDQDMEQTPHKQLGFVAQELQPWFPSLVAGKESLSVDYARLSAVAIAALQELKTQHDKQLDTLQAEQRELAATNARLALQLDAMTKRLEALEAKR